MAFRLLHLSDLHLGQRFHDQDRSKDEQYALDQVSEICRDRLIDVVVLAGDIFDTANPGAKEVQRYHRFLAELALDIKVGTIVVIAGNHDSALRIEGPREIFEQCNIHTIGSFQLQDNPEKVKVKLKCRQGHMIGHALAIPYLKDGDIRVIKSGETAIESAKSFRQAVQEKMTELHAQMDQHWPYISIGHAFCTNATLAGDERPVQIGNLGTLPAAALAGGASYLALGHLHRPQALSGNEHWRYSGSLLPTGFDECDTSCSVVYADIPDAGPATNIEQIPLQPHRQYLHIKGPTQRILKAIETLTPAIEAKPSPWLKISIKDHEWSSGLQQVMTDLAIRKGWQVLGIQVNIEQKKEQGHASNSQNAESPPQEHLLSDPKAVFETLLDEKAYPMAQRNDIVQAFQKLREDCEELLGPKGERGSTP
jgi:exonuclease SbcD